MSKAIGWFQEKISKPIGNLLPAHLSNYGEEPPISFQDFLEAYVKDPSCKSFVDFLADQTIGAGFYTVVDSTYQHSEEAKKIVDKFCEDVNLDELLQIGTREIIATGNSFWEKIEPTELPI